MQGVPGPNAPWPVGSLFLPPQLLTSDLGPLFFNPLGKPHGLFSTGHPLQQFETSISVSEQVQNLRESGVPFICRDLLDDHIKEEESFNKSYRTYGNRFICNKLQGLECSDGQVLLFFICGEGANKLACTVYYPGTRLRPAESLLSCSGFEQTGWSVSPAVESSIHQLSAVWASSTDNGAQGHALVAARSIYNIHFYTVSLEGERVQFLLTAVSKFQVPSTHVTWNPFVNREAAVILESGAVCLFDVEACDPNRVVGLVAKLTLESPAQSLKEASSSELNGLKCSSEEASNENEARICKDLGNVGGEVEESHALEKKWWRCEFGWLPQTLLVVNCQETFLVDLRKDVESKPTFGSSGRKTADGISMLNAVDVIATVKSSLSSRFCSSKARKENILAFARADNSEMYVFAVATEYRLMLFDTRQPQVPILQWEHGMWQDPPNLLIMCPLSKLRSVVEEEKGRNGRAILAASFKTGDVRVFCYGHEVSVRAPLSNDLKRQKLNSHDWSNATYAWEIPSRLSLPQADEDDWREILNSPEKFGEKHDGHRKSKTGLQNIAGLVLLSDYSGEPTLNETFTVLQLTGHGKMLAQTYQASDKIEYPLKASISCVADTFGQHATNVQGKELQVPHFEVLPCFLKYIRTGSVLRPYCKNFEQGGKCGIAKNVDVTVDTYQDGTNPEAVDILGMQTNETSATLSSKLSITLDQGGLDSLLKAFVQNMDVPLSIYEVAQKVLSMGLPEKLSPLAAGIPSDLDAIRHRGYKFPLVSRLLCSMKKSCESENHRTESQSADPTLLVPNNSSNTDLQGQIPLPLLLEICSLEKPSFKGGEIRTRGTGIHEEGTVDTDRGSGNQLRSEDGQKVLLEGCQYLEGVIEELVSKTEPNVISLSQSTQDVLGSSDGEGSSDSQILMYHVLGNYGISSESGYNESLVSALGDGDVNTLDQMQANSIPVISKDIYSKFFAWKVGSEERPVVKRNLKIDPGLCPIQLSFTAEEELEDGELTALESMQVNFLEWQQSFGPYKNSC